ncbi:hypothetical protein [Conexibacter sp. SYSU D00693]|uniref:hypothetical protein n=1 Tax=Conexibacter sp. SYSU D00693 TaxID=2812560 RepID=UPI00196B6D7C|nr:hypothetical protein [Conexibacter sp. SYSU D00693]
MADLHAAEQFVHGTGRVLDRRRLDVLLHGADPTPVRDAVAAYRNADGGFGHGLEMDGRGPASQPASVELALRTLDECDAWDEALVRGACDWLQATAPDAGGTPFVDPAIEGWPHAPWWVPEPGLPPSLTTTGQVVRPLLARGVEHPWLDGALEWLWTQVDRVEELEGIGGGYELRGLLCFLDRVPDEARAQAALDRVWEQGVRAGLLAVDPAATGEVQRPLDLAPVPGGRLRDRLAQAVWDDHVDHLAAAQREDGGWTFSWPAWSPVAEAEWRGVVTVDAVRVLLAHGRT